MAANGNTKLGTSALASVTSGGFNSAFGESSLQKNTTGSFNTASGYGSLISNTTGNDNTAIGFRTLPFNSTGFRNTAIGLSALFYNTTGGDNTGIGIYSLTVNTTGSFNTATGRSSLYFNSTGNYNTAAGNSALYNNTTGSSNTAQGNSALGSNTTGMRNVGIGDLAGFSNSAGNDNVFIGSKAGYNSTGSNRLYISNNAARPLLYGVFSATAANNKLGVGTATVAVGDTINVWNGAHLTKGGVWTNASSRDLKDNIEALSTEDANKALAGLSPVRYVYKNSGDEEYMGFIAEDVPDLVAMNDHKSLSPMDIVAVLTTVTKEQKAELAALTTVTKEQQAKMTVKDSEIAALRDALSKQDEHMLRVSKANEERMLQMEMALAEVQRNQSTENQIGLRD